MGENKIYTAKDIQLYHEGKLSPQEMHALERAALEDPFLAEALEGYRLIISPAEDLDELNQRLLTRIETKDRKGILIWQQPWLRIAAIALFIVGAGWIMFFLNSKPSNNLAREVKQEIQSAAPLVTAPKDDTTHAQLNTLKNKQQEEIITQPSKETPTRGSVAYHVKSKKKAQLLKTESDAMTMAPTTAPALVQTPGLAQKDMARSMKEDKLQTLSGRITDTSGKPLAYSTIHNQETNKTVQTDANGNFSIPVKDSSAYVDIAAAGFTTKRALLKTDTTNTIALAQSTGDLNEVVVMMPGKSRKIKANRDSSQRVRIEELEPEEGAGMYDDYVLNYFRNKEVEPDEKGSVTLTFEVNEQGEPVNITVLKSTCTTCVEDAVKMVREGPKWKKKKNKKAKITIRFDGNH